MPVLAVLVVLAAAGAQAPGGAIAGRVTDRATGEPVPRMIVTAVGDGERRTLVEALTDADGRYEMAGLAAGAYAVVVAHDEHRSTYLAQAFGEREPTPMAGYPQRFPLRLKDGERRTGVDVALIRALAIEGR